MKGLTVTLSGAHTDEVQLALMRTCTELAIDSGLGIISEIEQGEVIETEIGLSFATPAEIKSLNAQHRGIDSVTDVLSFPQFGRGELSAAGGAPALLLGDIVICPEKAKEQAEDYGHSYDREMLYLFAHGLLHLLGYDHEADDEGSLMRTEEEGLMSALGLNRDREAGGGL